MAMPEVVFTLKRFGFLRISAVAEQDPSVPVLGTIMTLSLPGGVTQRIEAHPGDAFVDFGDLPTGTYSVDVRAPNYARTTAQVQVKANQNAAAPSEVRLRRLGAITGVVQSRLTPGWTEALPDAQVTVSRQGVSFPATTTTDGSYRVTGTTVTDGLVRGHLERDRDRARALGRDGRHGHDPEPGDVDRRGPRPGRGPRRAHREPRRAPGVRHGRHHRRAGPDHADLLPRLAAHRGADPQLRARPDRGGCPGTAGLYIFSDVLPLTYNLNISGGSYSPLTLPVTVGAGKTVVITVPITTPAGSVQGLVQHQTANGGTVPVKGAVVSLTPTDGRRPRTATSDANGQYAFTTVAPARTRCPPRPAGSARPAR